jgi:hypothetical protein
VVRRLLFVVFFIEVGLLLIVLPWSVFWERNYFVHAWPPLRGVLGDSFVRGAVSGLGFLNLFAGFAELAPVFSARERRHLLVGDRGPTEPTPDPPSGY